MAKKHQIYCSNSKTRRKAGRKWRRQAKETLQVNSTTISLPYTKPTKSKTTKRRKKDYASHVLDILPNL